MQWCRVLWLTALMTLVVTFGKIESASAYPWMIRHDYAGCNMCHADPSGGGLLTPYGRAQGEILLRMRYGQPAGDEEPGKVKDFLFGLVPTGDSILLGGDVRTLALATKPSIGSFDSRVLLMQADATGQISIDRVRANGSLGFAQEGANGAAITHGDAKMVSRVHWVGVDLGADREVLVRAGRMNLPFGIRSIEHTMWIRSETRTDINAAQQHGVAVAYNGNGIRAEIMGIAGNFQLSPDAFRERGYSAYVEVAPTTSLAIGASSLITHASRDVDTSTPEWRHAHGVFARYSPKEPLVLSAEADFLMASHPTQTAYGMASMLQADLEFVQGLHGMVTGEILDHSFGNDPVSFGGWLSGAWFFAPHADVRIDAIEQSVAVGTSRIGMTSLLAQLHLYL